MELKYSRKNGFITKLALSVVVAGVLFSGCGSDDDESSSVSGRTIGELNSTNATVCIDYNGDLICQDDEPTVNMLEDGTFELFGEIKESSTLLAYDSNKSLVYMSEINSTNAKNITLSPITTLVWSYALSKNVSYESATNSIADLLEVSPQYLTVDFEKMETLEGYTYAELLGATVYYNSVIKESSKSSALTFATALSKDATDEKKGSSLKNWALKAGLKFGGSEVVKALGLKSQPAYVKQLNELIDGVNEINQNLQAINQNLSYINSTLTAIFNQMVADKYTDSEAFFNQIFTQEDTTWATFTGDIAGLSNEQILASTKALSALNAGVINDTKLTELSENSAKLSGISATGGLITYINQFLNSRNEYRDSIVLVNKAGVKGVDYIYKIDDFNEALTSYVMTISIELQRVYAIEALSIYLQANSDSMDDANKNIYSILIAKENNVSINYDFDTNMANLNIAYEKKFNNLSTLIDAAGTIISDNNSSYKSAIEYIKDHLPSGEWRDKSTLYSWRGVTGGDSIIGSYDGITLKAHINASKDATSFSSITLTNCNGNDNIITTTSDTPYLECKYLNPDNFVSVKSSEDIFGLTTYAADNHPGWNNTDKITLNKDRIYVLGDGPLTQDGALSYKEHYAKNKIIQYNFTNGERALFQFATMFHVPLFEPEYKQAGVSCGSQKSSAYWGCKDTDYNNKEYNVGGHAALTLVSKSGKSARVFVGARGTENNYNVKGGYHTQINYLDTCVTNFSSCGDANGDHQ